MKKRQLPKSIDFLSSHGLTVISLLFLMIITVIGTIDQKFIGLYQSQKVYFESMYFFPKAWGYVSMIPLPGGYTILAVLFVNLILAFVFKFRWRLRTAGVIICHIGLLLLLIGSYLTYAYSVSGHMTFPEQEQRDYFTSYTDNQITIEEALPGKDPQTVLFGNDRLFKGSNLLVPSKNIHIEITYFYKNCYAARNQGDTSTKQQFVLVKQKPAVEAEVNVVGAYITAYSGKNSIGTYYLYQFQEDPLVFHYQGTKYSVSLQRRKFAVPFSLKLLKFTRELYPGTQTPKHYESKVTLFEKDTAGQQTGREILISMNRPLRHKGYTFYQSSFNQEGAKFSSTLAVMKNPAEEWPYISCLLVVLGMIIHFMPKLFRFAKRQSKK